MASKPPPRLRTLKPRLNNYNPARVRQLGTTSQEVRISGRELQRVRFKIYKRDLGVCQMCNRVVELYGNANSGSNVDHIIPLSVGGDYSDNNLWTLCIACHELKTERERKAVDGIDPIAHALLIERRTKTDNKSKNESKIIDLGFV